MLKYRKFLCTNIFYFKLQCICKSIISRLNLHHKENLTWKTTPGIQMDWEKNDIQICPCDSIKPIILFLICTCHRFCMHI